MSESAETLGARLRAERERKGLSAQKAADELHLDGWVIDALESDDYARIGPSVYGKGHLKRYAQVLGLPLSEIMAAYEGRSAAPASVPGAQASMLRMRASDSDEQEPPWPLIGGAAALVLVAAATVFWWKPWSARGSVSPAVAAASPAPSDGADAAGAPSAAAGDVSMGAAEAQPTADAVVGLPPMRDAHTGAASRTVSATSTASLGATTGVTATAAGAAANATGDGDALQGLGRARLRLSFSADSWVDVHDAAGRRLFAGSGRANSVKIIAGDAPLRVYLGFASGVQVEVNSRVVAIGPQFVTGDAAHFDAGADGVLRRDTHAAGAVNSPRPRG
jgi:cytoskeleton protein RodZ